MSSLVIIGTRGYPSFYGGFETAVRHLAPHFADRGWAITVYGRRPDSRSLGRKDPRVRVVPIAAPRNKALETLWRGLVSSLHAAATKPDAALVMNVANGFFLPILKARGIRTIVNVDGIEWERAKWGKLARLLFKTGAQMTARFADEIIVDSKEIGNRWRGELGREGVFIPYGGIPSNASRAPLELESSTYVLMVARFVPENTVEEFFDAAIEISKQYQVVVVGSSGYGDSLDRRAKELSESGVINWLGHLENDEVLHALWQHCGLYFHGHSVGGTNPALVQAMASGAAVLARDTKFNREVLNEAGEYCLPDASDISASVLRLMPDTDKRMRLSGASRDRAASNYDWGQICDLYETTVIRALKNAPYSRTQSHE